jgi:hypothetical protein
MKPEIRKILDTVLRKKEQTRISREIHETITITLETMKHELMEEEQLEQMLREIAETTMKRPCNIIKHPSNNTNVILNTPTIKIQQSQITRTIACREIKLHDILEISTTFKAETIEIETPQKKYIIITNIIKEKPSH